MTQFEQEKQAQKFVNLWKDKGNERSDAQKFWIQLLRDVLGIDDSEQYIDFELAVKLNSTSFADGYINETHTLIEMKGSKIDLDKPENQSVNSYLTPYQQAKRYSDNLGYTQRARWIVVSNFKEIRIYDMERPHSKPEMIFLEELPSEINRLKFLVDKTDENIKKEETLSLDAGKIVGIIYKELMKEYKKIEPDETKFAQSINILCVRIVFCLYAEDAGLFGQHNMFYDYLKQYPASEMRQALINLFKILDTKPENRDPFENPKLLAFPYVNGGLFEDESITIPQITDQLKDVILKQASENFNWSEISPAIFGSVFESTLNPDKRREGGMHYTYVQDIHKVIDPLFLNELTYELDIIINEPVIKTRKKKLIDYQNKLASLKFLDPACGSGNFLTETYLSLRKLENRMIESYMDGQTQLATEEFTPIKVSIQQFYGIEINDFAVTVSKTALWIAESQMFKKTQNIIIMNKDFLPLQAYTNIIKGNALRIDWNSVIPSNQLNYIIGNPPFVGSSRTDEKNIQKEDMNLLFSDVSGAGKLDYVCGWYRKASKYIKGSKIRCAFVSTNSITQGEQVSLLWKTLFEKENIEIIFAHRSFKWSGDAAVICVIIGFKEKNKEKVEKILFDGTKQNKAKYINGYLLDLDDLYIKSRTNSINKELPKIIQGNKPWDGGYLILSSEEKNNLVNKYPITNNFIKLFVGGNEIINKKERYCLWLKDINPKEYIDIPEIKERLKNVSRIRKETKTQAVQLQAEQPMLFSQIRQPDSDYLGIPEVSSHNRKYIPMVFLSKDIISSNKLFMIPNASLYLFGLLISNVHMAWMRTVAGRLGEGYSYSPSVYNNFPLPQNISNKEKSLIENTAIEILEARKKYNDSSLSEMYNNLDLYVDLKNAHIKNNMAVMSAYKFDYKKMSELDCVAELMKLYQKLINNGDN